MSSIGWNWSGPAPSQRCAPLTCTPKPGTRTSRSSAKRRRAAARVIARLTSSRPCRDEDVHRRPARRPEEHVADQVRRAVAAGRCEQTSSGEEAPSRPSPRRRPAGRAWRSAACGARAAAAAAAHSARLQRRRAAAAAMQAQFRRPPPAPGSARRAPRSRGTGRSRRRPVTAGRPRPAAPPRRGRDRLLEVAAVVSGRRRRSSAARSSRRGLADQVDGLAALRDRRRERREVRPLPLPPAIRWTPPSNARAPHRGGDVGRLGVVDVAHAAAVGDLLEPVRDAGERAQPARDRVRGRRPRARHTAAAAIAFSTVVRARQRDLRGAQQRCSPHHSWPARSASSGPGPAPKLTRRAQPPRSSTRARRHDGDVVVALVREDPQLRAR